MASDQSPQETTSRHTARKNAARDLSARTGMNYTAALRYVSRDTRRMPRHRWILTDEVRAWFAGKGWRNVYYDDLYDWVDGLTPTYDCDHCSEPGDARDVDSSIKLVIAAYDPDLSPLTRHLATDKYHATCKASTVTFARPVDIQHEPWRIGLPASARPDAVGEFELHVRAVLDDEFPDEASTAVLLVSARVVDGLGHPAGPWLNELHMHLSALGFDSADAETGDTAGWALRIATDYPSTLAPEWIALRTPESTPISPQHLFRGAIDLPAGWAAAARTAGYVTVVLGACTSHWTDPQIALELPVSNLEDHDPDETDCTCEQLTASDIVDLAATHSFLTFSVPVVDHVN